MRVGITLEQRLQKQNFKVINHIKYCAISGVVMYGDVTIDDDFPTAATDGRNVRYGRKFIEGLSDPELRFLILHENYHKAHRHLSTWQNLHKKNPQMANMACDYVINLALQDLDDNEGFISMPAHGCLDERFRGMDSGQVFRILEQEQGDGKGKGKGKGKGGGNGTGFDHHDWDAAKSMTEAEQREVQVAIDKALRQGAILAGKRKGQLDRSLGQLLEPKINWREALREFIVSLASGKDQSTWRTVGRRLISQGIYMPGSYSEAVGRIGVDVDTSGSIDHHALREALSEIKSICESVKPEAIDLLYWDHVVQSHEKYSVQELDQLVTSTKPKGGGGTTPSCITAYMREHNLKQTCAIVFTDGHVGNDWGGNWPCPVLFVIVGGNKVVAPVGKTIHI